MEERKKVLKKTCYLFIIVTLTIMAFLAPIVLEKEVSAAEDSTVPIVTILSNNANNKKFAKLGDTITLSITTIEDIQKPTVTIAGQLATVIGSGGTYTATYTVGEETPEGVAGINITYADIVITATTNSSTVTVDKSAPTLLYAGFSEYKVKEGDVILLSINASEDIQIPTVTIAGETASVGVNSGDIYFAIYTVVAGNPEGVVGINITYADEAGNAGTPVTAETDSSTVRIDRTVPILSRVTIESDNNNQTLAKLGDTVTLTITSNEDISTPIVTIAGQPAKVTGSGDTYTAIYTVLAGTTEGVAGINIRFVDEAGNVGIPIAETTNNSTVTIAIPNLLPTVKITSNNENNTEFATVGDTITLWINRNIPIPTVTIAGETANVGRKIDSYVATYTVVAETPEGLAEFEIIYADYEGRVGIPATETTNSSIVTIDRTVPTLEAVTIESDNGDPTLAKIGDTITLRLTASEDLDTLTVTIAGQSAIVTGSGSSYTATYTVVAGTPEAEAGINITYADFAGNPGTEVTATTDSSTVTIHTSTQPLPYVAIASNNGYNTALAKVGDIVTLTIMANEEIPPTVTIAGETAIVRNIYGQIYVATYKVVEGTSEGAVVFKITYTDEAGNTDTVTATTDSSTVKIVETVPTGSEDKIAPVIHPVADASINTEAALTWTAPRATANDNVDGDISDEIVVTYFNADETIELADLDAARTELAAGRDVVVKYNVNDAAGNVAIEVSATFRGRTVTRPLITRGNWALEQKYAFTTNEPIVEYSLDGGDFIATTTSPAGPLYIVNIGDNLPHQLVLKDTEGDLSEAYPIEEKATSNDNLMFYASQGLLPWDSDSNWQFNGAGAITPDIFDEDGNCKKEYGNGAACYKIYNLDVDGEQVKVLQQLDDSSTAILQTVRPLDQNDYNNLYRYGGSVRGKVIVPAGDTYAGIGDPNTGNYAGNSQAVGYGAFVGLQFETLPSSVTGRRYGFNITYSGEHVKIVTSEGNVVLNGNAGAPIGGSQAVDLPLVKAGDSLDFELRIPQTAGLVGILPKAEMYVNEIFVGETNFNTFGDGSKGNKVIISSGSTGGTNRAIIIENFGSVINTGDIDVLAPVSVGANAVDNPIYTFESNEEVSGYQVNDNEWVTVEANYQITDILLIEGQNDVRVRDISGNIDTYKVHYGDISGPIIKPVDGAVLEMKDVSSWTAPTTTANDSIDGDVSDDIVVTYYKENGTLLTNLKAVRAELTAGRSVLVKYNVSDTEGYAAVEERATFRVRTIPAITRGNWTIGKNYNFAANELIVEYSLDGDSFKAINTSYRDSYLLNIRDNGAHTPHTLVLKDAYGDVSGTYHIQARAGYDNRMFYASKGLLPWDYDYHWDYDGTGSITPDILDADGNCKNEYGEGAACYKIYELDVDGEQVKVLQQLDDSSAAILRTVRPLEQYDYNNLYRYGGSVRGRVILPAGDTYAGIGDPNTGNYAGNSQAVGYGVFVGLQFEAGMIPGSTTNRRYGLNITYEGKYVKIITHDGSVVLNGNAGVAIGSSQTVNLPIVKVGEPLDFEIRIPQTAGSVGILPKAEMYVNEIFVGETNFNTGGSTDNKVVISSASTGGTNRAIIIENFGSVINTDDDDISGPVFGGANVVDNPIYTFESNENLIGYQVNDGSWVTVEPTYQIRNILLSHGINDVRVSDLSGNIVTYQVNNIVIDNTAPVIGPVDDATVNTQDAATWIAPIATANDNVYGDISDDIVIKYFKADYLDTDIGVVVARTELTEGKSVVVKYNVSDAAGNAAREVSATFTAIDNTKPIIDPVAGGEVNIGDTSTWTTPTAIANDNKDGDISGDIVVTYYKADETTPLLDEEAARTELGAGNDVVVKYNVSDVARNAAVEVRAIFTPKDNIAPVIVLEGYETHDWDNGLEIGIVNVSNWTAPTATVTDNFDTGLTTTAAYFKADGTTSIDLATARTELVAGNAVVIKYNVSDAATNETVVSARVIMDDEAPVIVLEGYEGHDWNNNVEIGIGMDNVSNWTAPTATVTDNIDGDISNDIVVIYYKGDGTTSINLTVAKTELAERRNVIVKYNATDNAGNAADEIEARFTATTDTTPPVITSPGITYSSVYNLTANEKIGAYSINNGLSWMPMLTPSDSIAIGLTPGGTYRMVVKDVAGNVSIMKTVICDA